MHVLILTANADAPFVIQQRAALEERGVEFTTLPVTGESDVDDAEVTRSPLDYLRYVPEVRREVGPEYDLVHAHYGLTAPMALAQRRLPVVLSLWGSDLLGTLGPLSKACARFCDEVVVMSEEMQRALGTDATVVPDGVDLDRFRPRAQSAARDAVGWDDDVYQVLFPYSPSRSVKDYPRARRLTRAAADQLEGPVRLQTVYGVGHDQVSTFMNAADVLLLTSKSEGSPNAVKEALACNLPVVATDVGDVETRLEGVEPSVVSDRDATLVRGLVDVLEGGGRSNGREAVQAVSLERTTDELLAIYERVAPEATLEPQPSIELSR